LLCQTRRCPIHRAIDADVKGTAGGLPRVHRAMEFKEGHGQRSGFGLQACTVSPETESPVPGFRTGCPCAFRAVEPARVGLFGVVIGTEKA
jgi:hypothetical protein